MEPGTPQPTIDVGGIPMPLTWTKRSEAVLSKHGHTFMSLLHAMRGKTGFYAVCLAVFAAAPAARVPEKPEDVGEWLPSQASQVKAVDALLELWRHYYPIEAEKKSGLKR